MRFYYIDGLVEAPYTITLAEAKKLAREAAEISYVDIPVTVVDVSTDRQNILRLLTDGAGVHVPGGTVYTAKAKLKRRSEA